MRRLLFALGIVAGCAEAGVPDPNGNNNPDARNPDGNVPADACPDTDNDGACNAVDKCPGHDDRMDTDADTIADGCDRCPGMDDRPDANMNGTPDCAEVMTRTINLKQVGTNYWRGWQSNGGASHTTDNDNTLTGASASSLYNTYFVFSTAGFTATTIVEVKLELEMESYVSTDANETISVWDVSTAAATIETTGVSAAIFADLGGGTQFGSATVTNASVSTTVPVSFTLNAAAATDLKAKLGTDWVVGLKLDATPGYVRFSSGLTTEQVRTHRIVVRYIP